MKQCPVDVRLAEDNEKWQWLVMESSERVLAAPFTCTIKDCRPQDATHALHVGDTLPMECCGCGKLTCNVGAYNAMCRNCWFECVDKIKNSDDIIDKNTEKAVRMLSTPALRVNMAAIAIEDAVEDSLRGGDYGPENEALLRKFNKMKNIDAGTLESFDARTK